MSSQNCPLCKNGLRFVSLNWKEAVFMCPSKICLYPFDSEHRNIDIISYDRSSVVKNTRPVLESLPIVQQVEEKSHERFEDTGLQELLDQIMLEPPLQFDDQVNPNNENSFNLKMDDSNLKEFFENLNSFL